MLFGALVTSLENEVDAAAALQTLEDLPLFAGVQTMGEIFGETPGEYVANATRRFANMASSDDWLALMTLLERDPDPARAALKQMLNWALSQDRRGHHASGQSCSCGQTGGCADDKALPHGR